MSLLACIVFHYTDSGLPYLNKIVDAFVNEYEIPVKVIIDTNNHNIDYMNNQNIEVIVHSDLENPFYLAWMHRKHMKDRINDYDSFMYVEHDIYIPYINYLNCMDNYKILFPRYVPSFVRIEEKDGEKYAVDVVSKQFPINYYWIGDKKFVTLDRPFNPFWTMPKRPLLDTMTYNFVRVSPSREEVGFYPAWELVKLPMVEMDGKRVSEKCYGYHLTNNYSVMVNSFFGKTKVNDLFTLGS